MAHASNIVRPLGPDAPYGLDNIPMLPRNGALDLPCPVCHQRGQWNTELDLVSFRCKRQACDTCLGAGWIETGNDARLVPDIIMTPEGYPKWILRAIPSR
jgi:hypothetical protein